MTNDPPDESGESEDRWIDEVACPGDDGDMAADALAAAKEIVAKLAGAGGTPGAGAAFGASGRRRYGSRGRGRRGDRPIYSGAAADGRDPVALGVVIKSMVVDQGWQAPLAYGRLMGQWSTVVGPDIAARCHPVSLTEGVLRIAADTTAWATQLRLIAPQLLARINAEVPAGMVKRLTIHGPAGPTWKRGPWSVNGRGVRDTYG
jgi:predicted nucleic acid-binding Zn ribbon protein